MIRQNIGNMVDGFDKLAPKQLNFGMPYNLYKKVFMQHITKANWPLWHLKPIRIILVELAHIRLRSLFLQIWVETHEPIMDQCEFELWRCIIQFFITC